MGETNKLDHNNCPSGEVVDNESIDPEPIESEEPQVVALLPLIREPNRSLTRLYRTSPSTITNPIFIGTTEYRDLFILDKLESDVSTDDADEPQRFVYTFDGFHNGVQEKRTFHLVYNQFIPRIAKERLTKEFMDELRSRCTELSSKTSLSLSSDADYLSASPISNLIQTMLVLRDSEAAEHLQYVDIEVLNVAKPKFEVPKTCTNILLPSTKRPESIPIQRCRITGNHVV